MFSSRRLRVLTPALACSLAAVLAASACTDDPSAPGTSAAGPTPSATASTATRSTATTGGTATTSTAGTVTPTGAGTTTTPLTPSSTVRPPTPSPSASAKPTTPPEKPSKPAVIPATAMRQTTTLLTRMRQAEASTGKEARDLREQTYAGPEADAAKARALLRSEGDLTPSDPIVNPVDPNLLAISAGPKLPAYLFAQTTPQVGALPQLHVLRTNDKGRNPRIIHTSTMLPGASLRPFDPRGNGSPVLGGGAKGLNVKPRELVESYATSLGSNVSPDFDELPFRRDPFFTAVRSAASKQAADVSSQALFSQRHAVVPDSITVVKRADDWALVFAVLERTDRFEVKDGSYLEGPETWLAFLPRETRITQRAELKTLEFVVFSVPEEGIKGKAKLIAASEQLVGASGE